MAMRARIEDPSSHGPWVTTGATEWAACICRNRLAQTAARTNLARGIHGAGGEARGSAQPEVLCRRTRSWCVRTAHGWLSQLRRTPAQPPLQEERVPGECHETLCFVEKRNRVLERACSLESPQPEPCAPIRVSYLSRPAAKPSWHSLVGKQDDVEKGRTERVLTFPKASVALRDSWRSSPSSWPTMTRPAARAGRWLSPAGSPLHPRPQPHREPLRVAQGFPFPRPLTRPRARCPGERGNKRWGRKRD